MTLKKYLEWAFFIFYLTKNLKYSVLQSKTPNFARCSMLHHPNQRSTSPVFFYFTMPYKKLLLSLVYTSLFLFSCQEEGPLSTNCSSDQAFDNSRGNCTESLSISPSYNESIAGTNRIISSNSIPAHIVGLFGGGQGSLNSNVLSAQSESYTVVTNPSEASSWTPLLGTNRPNYSFGILLMVSS